MPKDMKNTNEINVNDMVKVPCRITAINGNTLTLKTMNPSGTETLLTLNANQVLRD